VIVIVAGDVGSAPPMAKIKRLIARNLQPFQGHRHVEHNWCLMGVLLALDTRCNQ
jgi:hypothetical protein